MTTFAHMTLLEIIEGYATDNGGIDSEEALSELFDEGIAPHVIEAYSEDDTIAMSEAFSNWSDSLCKEGSIHSEQYTNYEYTGKYS